LPGKQAISPLVDSYLAEGKAKRPARDEARRLYDVLLNPIPEAKTKDQLIVVRDGQLHLLPFDALIDTDNQYVVESKVVVYSPSATSLFLLRTTTPSNKAARALLAVGGVPYGGSGLQRSAVTRGYTATDLFDLPSSSDEARAAVTALPHRSNTLLLGKDATESAFKKAISHNVIHLAVHAIASDTRPDRASVVMLSDPRADEDGFLQASEVVQLPLHAELVVLSACETAVGPLEGQEGISNLSRAFLLAGARTVVSTLWSVNDDTTLYLMKKFYAELARHRRAPDALKAAKNAMLRDFGPTQAVPYYWAGFTVEGLAEEPTKD
jgi:CHAT domain-containing protein